MKSFFQAIFRLIGGVRGLWRGLRETYAHLTLLDEKKERELIQNTKAYLETVQMVASELRKAGASDAEIKKLLDELQVSVVRATMEGLIRKRNTTAKSDPGHSHLPKENTIMRNNNLIKSIILFIMAVIFVLFVGSSVFHILSSAAPH